MNERVPLPEDGGLRVPEGEVINKLWDEADKTRNLVYYVVVVLLIMVATMILSLQIAIWGSEKSTPSINVRLDDYSCDKT